MILYRVVNDDGKIIFQFNNKFDADNLASVLNEDEWYLKYTVEVYEFD